MLLARDVPARVVMEMLGHSQISVTLDTYSHVSRAMQREAAKQIGDFMQSAMDGKDHDDKEGHEEDDSDAASASNVRLGPRGQRGGGGVAKSAHELA